MTMIQIKYNGTNKTQGTDHLLGKDQGLEGFEERFASQLGFEA